MRLLKRLPMRLPSKLPYNVTQFPPISFALAHRLAAAAVWHWRSVDVSWERGGDRLAGGRGACHWEHMPYRLHLHKRYACTPSLCVARMRLTMHVIVGGQLRTLAFAFRPYSDHATGLGYPYARAPCALDERGALNKLRI